MGEAICSKCGASFPEEANFCQSCGAKKVATPQYATQPIYGIFGTLFSKNLIVAGVCFGILFAWIGSLISTLASSNADAIKAAVVLGNMGFAALSLFLLGGGIYNKEIDKYIRLGMVIMGAYIVVTIMSTLTSGLTSQMSNLFSSLPGYPG